LLILRCWILFWRELFNFLLSKKNIQIFWERFFKFNFYFYFHFFLEGKDYVVPFSTVVTGILDMRPGKHDLHFLVGVELLPHAFVNILDKKMHIGVYFIYFYFLFRFYLFLYIIKIICIYFIHSFPLSVRF
jgi:hypothetical protein